MRVQVPKASWSPKSLSYGCSWVLGIKLTGSGGASHVLNHLAVSEEWGVAKKPNKQYRLLSLYLFASQNLRKDPVIEDTTQFGHRTWRN